MASVHAPVEAQTGERDLDFSLEFLIGRATAVFGTRDEALRWLGTPIPALNYSTPMSVLGSFEGSRRVEDVLGQIEHGIW
jgi:hypothetical protein